jgi:hypothetical protein
VAGSVGFLMKKKKEIGEGEKRNFDQSGGS